MARHRDVAPPVAREERSADDGRPLFASAELSTVRVKDPAKPGDFMVVNESDFDPTLHELFEEE